MNLRSSKTIGVLLGCVLVGMLLVLPRLVEHEPATLGELSGDPGAEALAQIYGSPDASYDPEGSSSGDVEPGSSVVTIQGQVLLPTGEPAAGAAVTAQRLEDETVFEAVTDTGGMFQLGLIPDDRYAIDASMSGYGPAIAIGIRPGPTLVRLVLQSGRTIRGLVVQGEEPVPYAVVHVGGPGMFPQRVVSADNRGQFELSGLRPGGYEIVATASGFGSGFGGRLVVDSGEGEADRLEMPVYPASRTTVRIVDGKTGDPVVSAVLSFSERELHVLNLSSLVLGGTAVVDHLPRGDYRVRVRAAGYLPFEGDFRTSSADSTVEIELSRGTTVRGTVRDSAGNPVPVAAMTAVIETDDGGRWELRRTIFDDFHRLVRPDGTPFWLPSLGFSSDSEGAFELTGLPSGSGRVVASRRGYAPAVSARLLLLPEGLYEPVELVLVAGRVLRGRVEDGGGGAVSGAFVSARPPSLPAWLARSGVTTTGTGMFELNDLPADVIVEVRHPDFAAAEVRLGIPEEGLDNVIVRLSGEQLPTISGRLFTARGASAFGALVWLMHGDNELPVCQATVGADAWFEAVRCSALPERLIASYPGHAPLTAELGDVGEPRDWDLGPGGELAVVNQRVPVFVRVEPLFQLPRPHWPRPEFGLDRWSRYVLEHVAPGTYRVTCTAEGFGDSEVEVRVSAGRRVEAACPTMQRMSRFPLYVVDAQSAPVEGALVLVDRVEPPIRAFTDSRGRIEVVSRPGIWLDAEALHEEWGRGFLRFYSPYQPRSDPYRILLDSGIGGEDPEVFLGELDEWGVVAVADGRAVVVDEVASGSPAAGMGLRRHDRVLWARPISDFRFSIGVRRDGELLTFEIVREPGGG